MNADRPPAAARALWVLLSPPYLVALSLLAVNDHILKSAAPGVITGKLSDFAGIFAVTVLFSAFWPRRAASLCVAIAVLFVIWKLPSSTPLLRRWNELHIYSPTRVADLWDLTALVVLPFAYLYVRRAPAAPAGHGRVAAVAVSLASIVCFVATSPSKYAFEPPDGHALRNVRVPMPPSDVAPALERCRFDATSYESPSDRGVRTSIVLTYESRALGTRRDFEAVLSAEDGSSPGETQLSVSSVAVVWQRKPVNEPVVLDDLSMLLRQCLRPARSGA